MTALVGAGSPGNFQAAWYYSIIVAAMLAVVLPAGVYAGRGARSVWRSGDHQAALVIAAVTTLALLFFVGMLITAAVALLRRSAG